jgi:hypothetical protein
VVFVLGVGIEGDVGLIWPEVPRELTKDGIIVLHLAGPLDLYFLQYGFASD